MTTPDRPGEPEQPAPPSRPTDQWTIPVAAAEPVPADAFERGTAPVGVRLPVTPVRKPAGRSSRVVNVILGVAAIIAIGGLAFAAGRMTAPATAANLNGQGGTRFGNGQFPGGGNGQFPGGGNGQFAGGGNFLRGGVLEGTVVSSTSTSITIEIGAGNGGQAIQIEIPISSTTAVHTQADATSSDIATGQKVLVQLGTATAGATAAPIASGAPREVQAPASDITIVSP